MHTINVILVMLFAVIVSTYIARLAPLKIPLPLFQILIGALLSWAGFQVVFDSHLFLLLFIPPLLFLDGWRIPKGAILHDWPIILSLAIGLVVFTVIGLGFFIHWLIPAIPLAVTFALAAILSPTDPVAVSAISANSPIPSRIMHILEGESLFNDATGLVCFSFAVAAAMTGIFSIGDASIKFLIVAGGGVMVGIAISWVVGLLNTLLIKRVGEDAGINILISILIPFAAYLAAEHLGVSGILAAAVAGIASHYYELTGNASAATRMQRSAVWDTIQITLNGIIFIMLGEQLPGLINNMSQIAETNNIHSEYTIFAYIIAITLGLGVLRFVWVSVSLHIASIAHFKITTTKIPFKTLLIVATAGVRGAITLAGILTLPLFMLDGSAFPARDLAIFIAMGVILLSLIIASVALPLLTKDIDPTIPLKLKKNNKSAAKMAATETAIKFLESHLAKNTNESSTDNSSTNDTVPLDPTSSALRIEAINRTLDVYRRRLAYGDTSGETNEDRVKLIEAENAIYLQALQAERDVFFKLRLNRSLADEEHRELVREIDLLEASLTSR